MQFYLKSTQKVAMRALKTGDWSESDKVDAYNQEVLRNLFCMLINGQIKTFYTRSKNHMTIWHLSTRENVLVQESHLWIRDGELLPTYHADINSFEELIKENGYTVGQFYRTT